MKIENIVDKYVSSKSRYIKLWIKNVLYKLMLYFVCSVTVIKAFIECIIIKQYYNIKLLNKNYYLFESVTWNN